MYLKKLSSCIKNVNYVKESFHHVYNFLLCILKLYLSCFKNVNNVIKNGLCIVYKTILEKSHRVFKIFIVNENLFMHL